jgi:hypothetical protein
MREPLKQCVYQKVKLVLYIVTRISIGISYKYQKFSTYDVLQALHLHSTTIILPGIQLLSTAITRTPMLCRLKLHRKRNLREKYLHYTFLIPAN